MMEPICAACGAEVGWDAEECPWWPRLSLPASQDANLPGDIFSALGKVDGIPSVTMNESRVTFTYSDRALSTVLIDVKYPRWSDLIPERPVATVKVDPDALAGAAARALLLTSYTKTNQPTIVTFTDDSARLRTSTQDRGESDEGVPAEVDGEPYEIRFNAKFLADALTSCGGGQVVIRLHGGLQPALLQAADDEAYLHLLMPMKPE